MKWYPVDPNQNDIVQFTLDQCKSSYLVDILNEAKDELSTLTKDPVFDGYASGDRNKVYAQVRAIYSALFRYRPELVYTIEPQDRFTTPLQQFIRTVDEVIKQREADCIDIVVLFASLLLKVGLNPIIAIVGPSKGDTPTHAILGYWLEDQTFNSVLNQWSAVKPYIKDITFLETTGVLRGNKKPFTDTSAEVLTSLPKDVRSDLSLPIDAKDLSVQFLSAQDDVKVFYAIDVIQALRDMPISVISIMGAKGGVGKGTIANRMAELIAETKK